MPPLVPWLFSEESTTSLRPACYSCRLQGQVITAITLTAVVLLAEIAITLQLQNVLPTAQLNPDCQLAVSRPSLLYWLPEHRVACTSYMVPCGTA